jgi:hypothetical protein
MMDDILQPFTNYFVVVYLDDILIFKKNWSEYLQDIQQVMHTLWQHKLYENLAKLFLRHEKVQYLGYIVHEHGVHIDPAKIQVICDRPVVTHPTPKDPFKGWGIKISLSLIISSPFPDIFVLLCSSRAI